MSEDLIRLMHALFLPGAESCLAGPWCPATDVYQTRQGWVVKFELAGVRTEDVDLEVSGRRMTVRGVRRDCTASGECSYYRMEITYSRFERAVELPVDLDRADIETEYRDGMLLVRIVPARVRIHERPSQTVWGARAIGSTKQGGTPPPPRVGRRGRCS